MGKPGRTAILRGVLGLLVLGSLHVFSVTASAHGKVPEEMKSMQPGRVIEVMESDFLVPGGFRWLPGPMFYLGHEKALGLSPGQKKRILSVARKIMPETIREGKKIETLKGRIVALSDGRKPYDPLELKRLLRRLGKREAEADFAHIEAHRACLFILRPSQRARLFSLLGKP
jgi:hypothetical protein